MKDANDCRPFTKVRTLSNARSTIHNTVMCKVAGSTRVRTLIAHSNGACFSHQSALHARAVWAPPGICPYVLVLLAAGITRCLQVRYAVVLPGRVESVHVTIHSPAFHVCT